jgi:hypothetical protein
MTKGGKTHDADSNMKKGKNRSKAGGFFHSEDPLPPKGGGKKGGAGKRKG